MRLDCKLLLIAALIPLCLASGCLDRRATNGSNVPPEEIVETESDPDPTKDYKREVAAVMGKVADWQIANFSYRESGSAGTLHDHGIDAWTNSTLYLGMFRWTEVAPQPFGYLDWLMSLGVKNHWVMPANFLNASYGIHHADELCIGQFYLGMYKKYQRPEMLSGVRARILEIMDNPPSESMSAGVKQSWTWCDALFMAPPVYAALAAIEGNGEYLEFMDKLFRRTYDHLYNKSDGLFFRDDTYFDKLEANGEKVYWGRGNGWVAAGLAEILRLLPENSPYRPFYKALFESFIAKLVSLQDKKSGFWHASLLDPDSYPSPETSVTALISYAVAFGINNGLLDAETYTPTVMKAWDAICEVAIDSEGKVGWIQPIGASPQSVTKASTAVYGVGAVLMAGAEICKMNE